MMEQSRLGRPPKRSEETTHRLRREIAEGRFGGSGALPGERQLADMMQVSRTTLRRALSDLVAEGVLVQRQGFGTVVSGGRDGPDDRRADATDPPALSFNTNGLLIGTESQRELWRGHADADADEALALAVAPGQTVYRVLRLLMIEDTAVAIESVVVSQRFLPNPLAPRSSMGDPSAAEGARAAEAIVRVRGARLTAPEATALGMDRATPVVAVQKAVYLADGRCCAFIRTVCPTHRLDLLLVGRPG